MTSPMDELLRLRASIDNLDAVLLHTLAERFKLTKQVGVLKAETRFRRLINSAKPNRFTACASWPMTQVSTRHLPSSSSTSSWRK